MFTSFARRLTGWYVAAAVTLVVAVLGAFAVVALVLYVHTIQDSIDADARNIEAFAVRATAQHERFGDAAVGLVQHLARPGVRMVAAGPLPAREREGTPAGAHS